MTIKDVEAKEILTRRQFFRSYVAPVAAVAVAAAVVGTGAVAPAAAQYRGSRNYRGNRRSHRPQRRSYRQPVRRNNRVDLYDWKQGMRDRMRNCVRRGTC